MNLLPCAYESGKAFIEGTSIILPDRLSQKAENIQGKLQLGIRPEFCQLTEKNSPGSFPAPIKRVEDLGNFKIVTAQLGTHEIKVKVPETAKVAEGEERYFHFPQEQIILYQDELAI